MKGISYVLVLLVFYVAGCSGHATIFASDSHCSSALAAGQSIMGKAVQPSSSNSLSIVVNRNGEALSSGDTYVAGEILTVSASSSSQEYVLQVTNGEAALPGGACSNQRRAGSGDLLMPSSGSVTINGGSASSKGTVTMMNDFVLTCCSMSQPAGTAAPSSMPIAKPSQSSNIAGVIMSLLFFVAMCAVCYYYLNNYETILANSHQYIRIPSFLAVITAALAMILVSSWVVNANPSSLDQHYLGAPNWKTNTFAWHPVLMVGGFLCGQVKAINDWNLFPHSHAEAKGWHIVFQTAALVCVFVGLSAVVSGYTAAKAPGYNTFHSWLGVAAIILFTSNYTLGFVMGLLKVFHPESILRKAFDLGRIHRVIGLSSLGLTNLAIVSGIMDALPTGVCIYPPSSPQYGAIFTSCQIAYSMGLMVVLSSLFTVLAVSLRCDQHSNMSNLRNTGKWQEMPDM